MDFDEKGKKKRRTPFVGLWEDTLVLLLLIQALYKSFETTETAEEGRCERDFDALEPRPGDDDDDEDKEDGLFFFGERRQRIRHRPESKRRRECRNGCSAGKSRRDEMDEDARRSDGEAIRRG